MSFDTVETPDHLVMHLQSGKTSSGIISEHCAFVTTKAPNALHDLPPVKFEVLLVF